MSAASPLAARVTDTSPDAAELIPWDWAITPKNGTDLTCPSRARILGTFGAVNAASLIFALVVVAVKSKLFGRWSRPQSASKIETGTDDATTGTPMSGARKWLSALRPWMLLWIVQVAFSLGANAINSHITQTHPGFDKSLLPSVADLTLFYTLRPRIAWAGVGLAGLRYEPFATAFAACQAAEMALQLCGLYYKVRIVAQNFPSPFFMKPDLLPDNLRTGWTMMSYPTFAFVIYTGLFLLGLAVS